MEHLPDLITRGASDLGIALAPDALESLVVYLGLLEKWNAKLNLVGPGSPTTWALRHVVDSLAPLSWVHAVGSLLDLGSGAGLPGIPLAVADRSASFLLVEPRANRAAFLRNVVASLKLSNVRVKEARAEDLLERMPLITGRAVAPPEEIARMASGTADTGGRLILFAQSEPPQLLGPSARRLDWHSYTIGSEPPRAVGLYELRPPEA